jgi:IPT/TIG domain
MRPGRRIRLVLIATALVVALPLFGQLPVSASTQSTSKAQGSALPFRGLRPGYRGSHSSFPTIPAKDRRVHVLTLAVGPAVSEVPVSGPQSASRATGAKHSAPQARSALSTLASSTPPSELIGFQGTDQSSAITRYGSDQRAAPPDPDIAVGPTQVVETTNSTVYVFSRTGGLEFSVDLNTFLNGSSASSYAVTDPRVIYDPVSGRFFLSDLDIYLPQSTVCGDYPDFDVVLASPSSTLSRTDSWYGFGWSPFANISDGLFADQPGLGISSSLVAATESAYDQCNGNFVESEILIIQKSDLLNRTFVGVGSAVDVDNLPFGLQPVQELGSNPYQYVVWNNSDAQLGGCSPSCSIGVLAVHGTPRAGNVQVSAPIYEPMTSTAVQCGSSFCFTPPADQLNTTNAIQTDDDRFLNAVWYNNTIWTAGDTTCTPSGDITPRSCLDFISVGASTSGSVTAGSQINNVAVTGAYLYYPAVSVDSAGDVITVFDESSSSAYESIMVAAIDSGASTLTNFATLHSSSTYYAPAYACSSSGQVMCRWGDYSGAAMDPSHPGDVWVVSEDTDGNNTSSCETTPLYCWNTYIGRYTFAGPVIASLTPSSGPVAGGQTVTVAGSDFGPDTTATFGGSPIGISTLTPDSFTFVTPQSATLSGGPVLVQATDALGTTAALTYTYVGLSNYVPITPFRLLDTRNTGGSIGPGVSRPLQVTGVGSAPLPPSATAVVLNVTAVSGSASSLLSLYPYGTLRPNAANLNFPAHTVIGNLVTVSLGLHSAQGWVNIYNALGSVNVVVDVEGYFTPQPASDVIGLFHPVAPTRVCDTRSPSPTPICSAHGALGPGASMVVNFGLTGGLPGDGTAEAAVVNVAGVAGTASTYLSLFPTNANGACVAPGTSTLNLAAGAVAANRVMVELGPSTSGGVDDAMCVFNAVGVINVVVDANGWYGSSSALAAGYQYQALAPTRICDTRSTSTSCNLGAIGGGLNRLITVGAHDGVPPNVSSPTTNVVAIIANLTGIAPTATTYLTLYPATLPLSRPTVSDLNLGAGAVLANLAVVKLDTAGDANQGDSDLYNSVGSVNVTIDLEGWFQ